MGKVSRCRPLLGTLVTIDITAPCTDRALHDLAGRAFDRIAEIGAKLSFHNSDSELSSVNLAAYSRHIPVSSDFLKVVETALQISAASKGAYDITIAPLLVAGKYLPDHGYSARHANWQAIETSNNCVKFSDDIAIDLGGIAKGYAVDQAFELIECAEPEAEQITVNAGGDLRQLAWACEAAYIRYPSWLLGRPSLLSTPMRNAALASSAAKGGSPSSRTISPASGKLLSRQGACGAFAGLCIWADAMTKLAGTPDIEPAVFEQFGATPFKVSGAGKLTFLTSGTFQ